MTLSPPTQTLLTSTRGEKKQQRRASEPMDAPSSTEWRSLPQELGLSRYEVSSEGRIRTAATGRLLNSRPRNTGYLYSTLTLDDGTIVGMSNHSLVASAFLAEDAARVEIDHINRNKTDNRPANLRRVTKKENAANRTPSRGRPSKPVLQLSKEGETIKLWPSSKAASEELGVSTASISQCCTHKLKSAGGFVWQYAEETSPDGEPEEWRLLTLPEATVGVSSLGRIRLAAAVTIGHLEPGGKHIVQTGVAGGELKKHMVHELVCRAFHDEPKHAKASRVRHIDDDLANNRSANLEWASHADVCLDRAAREKKQRAPSSNGMAVAQYNLDGTLAAVHRSMAEAARCLGTTQRSNISTACSAEDTTAAGYLWKRVEGDGAPPPMIAVRAPRRQRARRTYSGTPVDQFTLDGTFVATHPTMVDAAKTVGTATNRAIWNCCKGVTKTSGGFIWCYSTHSPTPCDDV